MKRILYCALLLALCIPLQISAQSLSSRLIDRESEEPIAFASVFFSKTSIGTTTDANGRFSLNMSGLREVDLVVSHIGFELYRLRLKSPSNLPKVIYLKRIEKRLAEVEISEKYAANRKKLLRKFEKAFLGQSSNRKKTRILNPEVLVLRESEDTIFAESLSALEVQNDALGYQIQFFLTDFQLNKNQDLRYKGEVFFEELELKERNKNKASKKRKKSYEISPKHFFSALFLDKLENSKYELKYNPPRAEGEFAYFDSISFADLDIRRGKNVDTLFLEGQLGIVNKGAKIAWSAFKGSNKYPTSIIRSLPGYYLVSKKGNLLNPEDIEEYGFWTKFRVAELLPLDYSPGPKEFEPSYQLLDSLSSYLEERPREKLFVHLNKYNFFSGEEIWFRAYLMDAVEHRQNSPSQIYHVELIDPNGKLLDSLSFHSAKANWGKFSLKPGLASGKYLIRAYTHYMRNRPQAYFFQEFIDIWGKEEEENTPKPSPPLAAHQESGHFPRLSFFPEGGKLIEGQENIMAFRLASLHTLSTNAEVVLEDENRNLISSASLGPAGFGSLSFLPEKGKAYKAYLKENGKGSYCELPPIETAGFRLRVINNDADYFRIKITHNEEDSLDNAFLIAHVRGALSLFIDDIETGQIINIPKNTLITGLVEFSLFNAKGEIKARRLAFNEFGLGKELLEISNLGKSLSGDEIEIGLNLSDTLKTPGETQLSFAVTETIFDLQEGSAIAPYVLLESDLGLMPASMAKYFPLTKENRKSLDLFLMSWEGHIYDWNEILSAKEKLGFLPEKGITIKGYTLDGANPKKKISSSIMVNTLSESLFIEESQSDESGYFELEAPLFLDSTLFIVQARKGNQKKEAEKVQLDGRRDVEIEFITEIRPEINLPPQKMKERKNAFWEDYAQDNALAAQAALDLLLDTVEIEARRGPDSRLYDVFNLNELDFVHKDMRGLPLLSMLKPGSRYEIDRIENEMYYLFWDRGLPQRVKVTFVINGMVTKFLSFQALSADLIDYIGIYGPAIVVQSRRNGPRSMEKLLKQGIKSFFHPGFHEGEKEFSPLANSAIGPSIRSHAIHWEADVKFDAEGQAKIVVPLHEHTQSISIKAEGISSEGQPISSKKRIDLRK
ncbi:MAG: carboxypeptidase-like regulatory domain-containing protein [Bacteroidota bacterium]